MDFDTSPSIFVCTNLHWIRKIIRKKTIQKGMFNLCNPIEDFVYLTNRSNSEILSSIVRSSNVGCELVVLLVLFPVRDVVRLAKDLISTCILRTYWYVVHCNVLVKV